MLLEWFKVDDFTASELLQKKMTEVTVNSKTICLLKNKERIFAFAATCPHAGARLCEGFIDALGRVVCPLHAYRYDPANGRNTSGEGYKLKTFPVEIRDDSIFIAL